MLPALLHVSLYMSSSSSLYIVVVLPMCRHFQGNVRSATSQSGPWPSHWRRGSPFCVWRVCATRCPLEVRPGGGVIRNLSRTWALIAHGSELVVAPIWGATLLRNPNLLAEVGGTLPAGPNMRAPRGSPGSRSTLPQLLANVAPNPRTSGVRPTSEFNAHDARGSAEPAMGSAVLPVGSASCRWGRRSGPKLARCRGRAAHWPYSSGPSPPTRRTQLRASRTCAPHTTARLTTPCPSALCRRCGAHLRTQPVPPLTHWVARHSAAGGILQAVRAWRALNVERGAVACRSVNQLCRCARPPPATRETLNSSEMVELGRNPPKLVKLALTIG